MQYLETKADLCPVCNGTGKYKKIIEPDKNTSMGLCSYETTCHGCNGTGWVTIPIYKTSITRG